MMKSDRILLAHGGGGQLTCELIEQVILPCLGAGSAENRGAGLAHVAWGDYTRNQCIQRGILKPKLTGLADLSTVQPIIHPGMKGWLARIGIQDKVVRQ